MGFSPFQWPATHCNATSFGARKAAWANFVFLLLLFYVLIRISVCFKSRIQAHWILSHLGGDRIFVWDRIYEGWTDGQTDIAAKTTQLCIIQNQTLFHIQELFGWTEKSDQNFFGVETTEDRTHYLAGTEFQKVQGHLKLVRCPK